MSNRSSLVTFYPIPGPTENEFELILSSAGNDELYQHYVEEGIINSSDVMANLHFTYYKISPLTDESG